MAVAWTDTPIFRLIDPDVTDDGSDALDSACGSTAGSDDLGGSAGFGGPAGPSPIGPFSDRNRTTPMTGSHIPGVDTGAKGGQTTYIDANGQLQTITSGAGSFGAGVNDMHPIYQQLAGQLGGRDAALSRGGASNDDDATDTQWSDEPLGDSGEYVDFLVSPDSDLPGADSMFDMTSTDSDETAANDDKQLRVIGDWFSYAHVMSLRAQSLPPGSVSLDTASIDAASTAYQDAIHAFDSPDYGAKLEVAANATNAMIRANDWHGSPPGPTVLEPLIVRATPAPGGEGIGGGGFASPASHVGAGPSPGGNGGDVPRTPLGRFDQQLSDFNDTVSDELVDEGGQALRSGNDVGFVWNGLKYAFYNTFMPNSVEEGFIGVVGGSVAGKALGLLGKFGGRLFAGLGDGIRNFAGGLALRSHWFTRKSSRVLGQALEEAGFVRRPGDVAHHIVAGVDRRAEFAREILRNFGIGVNEASNGVFLPRQIHDRIHSDLYYEALNNALKAAQSKDEVIAILAKFREKLLAGTFP